MTSISVTDEPSETRVSRAEINLQVLTKMATNDECLVPLLVNFQLHLPAIIELIDQIGGQRLHKPLAAFLEQLLQVLWKTAFSPSHYYRHYYPNYQVRNVNKDSEILPDTNNRLKGCSFKFLSSFISLNNTLIEIIILYSLVSYQ